MFSNLSKSVRQYMLVTFNYWNFTITDGALRMLVVLYFYDLGYSSLEIASLFLFYEFFGVVTNLIGGWLGARLGLNKTMNIGLGMQWFQIEIEDDCAPGADFAAKWQAASPELHNIVDNGGKVAMHCMGGSGRTGLFAAHLLLEKGWDLSKVVQEVQALRPGAFTKPIQVEYINGVASA